MQKALKKLNKQILNAQYTLYQEEEFNLQKCNKDIQFLHIPLKEENYISHLMPRI